jgi:PAS domain S-box-containing protein
MEQLSERLRFETLLSDLIARFVNLPPAQLNPAIEEVLRELGEALRADRLTLAQPSAADPAKVFITHLYQARKAPAYPHPDDTRLPEGVKLAEGFAESVPLYKRIEMNKVVPWLVTKCRHGETVVISGREDLPEEALGDREFFSKFGTQSLVAIPLFAGRRWLGVLSIASFREMRVWPEDLVKRFQFVARVLASALEQFRLQVEVEERLRFEILIADLSSRFVNLPPDEADREIEGALRGVCEVLGIDNAVLWQWFSGAPGTFAITHVYYAPECPPPESKPRYGDFPWVAQMLASSQKFAMSSVEDLPPEAAVDKESARRFGIKSSLCLPLSVGGAPPVGILAFNTLRAERAWPDTLVQRLQLVAQVFANALARRRADQTLRESEELARATFEQAAVGIAHVGTDGRWLRVNDKLCSIVGFRPEELQTQTFQDITHPDDLDADLNIVRRFLSGEVETHSLEKRYIRKDQALVWVNLTISLVRTAAGAPKHFIVVVEEITDRKRADEALRLSEARLAAAADIEGIGFIEVDEGTGTAFADDRLCEIVGYPPDRNKGIQVVAFWKEHLHPSDLPRVLAERQEALDGNREDLRMEYRYLHPTLGERWIQHIGQPTVRDATGFAVKSFGVLRDITERKRAEEETLRLQREISHVSRVAMMGEISSSLAHELNQPLTAILSNAQAALQMLSKGSPDMDEIREILADIAADDQRAGAVIATLRGFLKKNELERQLLDVVEVVRDVLRLLRNEASLKNAFIEAEFGPGPAVIHGDRIQLQQVLVNLVVNALDAARDARASKPEITVRVDRRGEDAVRVSVADNGPGIPQDQVERIFEPYYTSKPGGLGMGLAIARSIVRSHGGRLWAEGNAAGGATFVVELPAEGGGLG